MKLQNKYVFLDLDESLIHTNVYKEKATTEREIEINIGSKKHPDVYVSQLRVGVHKLLEEIRALVGSDHVFMLTRSMWDYAARNNDMHKLGFQENQIYSREHIRRRVAVLRMEGINEDSQSYLIDNLSMFDLGEKFELMCRGLGFRNEHLQLFRISGYYGDTDGSHDISEKERSEIITLITGK